MKKYSTEWWQTLPPEKVGKETEKLVEALFTEWNASQRFVWHRLPDAKSARAYLKAQPADFAYRHGPCAGFVEVKALKAEFRLHNGNVAKVNELGHTERSSHQENKLGRGDLGALVLEYEGGTFNCGTGFDDATRKEIWDNQGAYMGRFAKVKSFLIGVKTSPRFPVFLGFRSREDM